MVRFLTVIFLLGSAYYWFVVLPSTEPDWTHLSEREWRQRLTPEQYDVLRNSFTEDPYTGPLLKEKREGTYLCAGCSKPLFSSSSKFDSGTGWPSFDDPIQPEAISHHRQNTPLAVVIEVKCKTCGGHLGHVFPDGPTASGKRYCMNSAALEFRERSSGSS